MKVVTVSYIKVGQMRVSNFRRGRNCANKGFLGVIHFRLNVFFFFPTLSNFLAGALLSQLLFLSQFLLQIPKFLSVSKIKHILGLQRLGFFFFFFLRQKSGCVPKMHCSPEVCMDSVPAFKFVLNQIHLHMYRSILLHVSSHKAFQHCRVLNFLSLCAVSTVHVCLFELAMPCSGSARDKQRFSGGVNVNRRFCADCFAFHLQK